jgi:YbbR domain-containing protein
MMQFLRTNWQLKVVAVGLAVMVWFSIRRASDLEVAMIHNVRVDPIVARGWLVEAVEPSRVSVEVRGERADVTTVTADHFQARPDLSAIGQPGMLEVKVDEAAVLSPAKIRVLKVQPSQVKVILKRLQSE